MRKRWSANISRPSLIIRIETPQRVQFNESLETWHAVFSRIRYFIRGEIEIACPADNEITLRFLFSNESSNGLISN